MTERRRRFFVSEYPEWLEYQRERHIEQHHSYSDGGGHKKRSAGNKRQKRKLDKN